jgi:hypothetical protein
MPVLLPSSGLSAERAVGGELELAADGGVGLVAGRPFGIRGELEALIAIGNTEDTEEVNSDQ